MAQIYLYIGPCSHGALALWRAATAPGQLAWRWAGKLGARGQTRLAMAALDPDHVDPLRAARGLAPEDRHRDFAEATRRGLARFLAKAEGTPVLISCDMAGRDLWSESERTRFAALFAGAKVVRVVACVPPAPTALAAHWSGQLRWGRVTPLEADLRAVARRAQPARVAAEPESHLFPELECPPQWLDAAGLRTAWAPHFPNLQVVDTPQAVLEAMGLPHEEGMAAPPALPSCQTLARLQALNPRLRRALASGLSLSRKGRARIVADITADGPPLDPADIAEALAAPGRAAPLLPPITDFDPDAAMARLLPRMLAQTRRTDLGMGACAAGGANPPAASPLPAEVRPIYARLAHSRYAPHNRSAPPAEAEAPFPTLPLRDPAQAERVLVACLKDEGPYLLEWLAFHRAIGIDHFVVYSNDCRDGSAAMLDRLAAEPWLTHIDNSTWSGASPQQAALNHAIGLPVVQKAAWVLHSDLDEFVNIRVGDGTLDALFAARPTATHWALTWRLFGSGGVEALEDRPVIAQFTRCAPAYCPKPHTAWGFKTLGRQIGAYGKLSCHRPTKPKAGKLDRAQWVNGSGRVMGDQVSRRGWRSTRQTVGYDLVQLNHYPLRSRDAFLVKRERGRALHVDREIGRNYWVRMDWNDHQDRSILRHLPRVEAGMAGLLFDPELARLHAEAVAWHQARAEALRGQTDVQTLLQELSGLKLAQTERAAYALALDHES